MNTRSPQKTAAEVWSLIEIFTQSSFQLQVPSAPPSLEGDAAKLAKEAAASAVKIARSAAALGVSGDDDANAQELWSATLENIGRVQKLYGLPTLPFQNKTLPRGDLGPGSSQ